MPSNLRRRSWLLLAVTITLQLIIIRSTQILKHDEVLEPSGQAFLKRSGGPFHVQSLKHRLEPADFLQTSLLAVPYEKWYADTPPALKPLVGAGLVIILIFLFSFIGISASDFFCPNLSTIAAYLGLNESTAGVTFLAFGNGSPDVFSTFSALKGGTFSLAIGELIGAASFSESSSPNRADEIVVSIVVGTIALIQPFHVPRHAFSRDILFFTISVIVLISVLQDGRLTLTESGAMVLLYLIYVTVVIIGNWLSKRSRDKETAKALSWARDHPATLPDLSLPEPTMKSPSPITRPHLTSSPPHLSPVGSPHPHFLRSHSHSISAHFSPHLGPHRSAIDTPRANFSLLGAIEFRDAINSLRKESESHASTADRTPRLNSEERGDYFGPVQYGHRRSVSQGVSLLRNESSRRAIALNTHGRGEPGPSTATSRATDPARTFPSPASDPNPWEQQAGKPRRPRVVIPNETHADVPSISVIDPTGHTAPPFTASSPGRTPSPDESRFRIRRHARIALRVLFPSLQSFRQKSIIGMILAITSVPAILALTLTLPVVDDGQNESEIALPVDDGEALNSNEPVEVPDADEDRLLSANVGEELHHLVDGGFSPLHSPMGLINHVALRRYSQDGVDEESLSKELLEDIREEEALEFHKTLTAAQCVLGPMFCALIIFRE